MYRGCITCIYQYHFISHCSVGFSYHFSFNILNLNAFYWILEKARYWI